MLASKPNRLGFIVAGLLLGILMAAMDNTIVATAMGTVVAELGSLDKFIWVTSAYMVTEMAGMPIFGKLSDMYGRKRFFIFGLIVFLGGSILCGTANSIVQLAVYRAIQGVGGGALMPIAFTIIFDIFPPEKRGKMAGLFGAVFGLSSIFGPLLGAYITDYIDWRWIFYINLPLGLLALLFVSLFYHESHAHDKQKIDWLGAFSLVGAIVCVMFALELGGKEFAWSSGVIIGLFSGFAVLLVLFLFIETRVSEPIISFKLFRSPLFAGSNLVGLMSGAAFIVATVYIPIYVQGVIGGTATNSGMILLPMMLGTVFGAQIGGSLTTKLSYRNIMLIFMGIFVIGLLTLWTVTPDISIWVLRAFMVIIGLGIGASFSVLGMSAIHKLDIRQRGTANSTIAFLRTFGMTIGITVFGVLQRNLFENRMASAFGADSALPASGSTDPRELLSEQARAAIPAPVLEKIMDALSSSIVHTFMWACIPAILALLFAFFMGKERLEIPVREASPPTGAVPQD